MARPQVLIVGAGPSGLVLALWLTRQGVAVRIIDKAAEPGTTSRAVAIQARTLELYRQLGLDGEVVADGRKVMALHLWVRGEERARVPVAEIGRGQSPYAYLLMYPQDRHERMLIAHLAAAGVEVERRTELVSFEDRGDGVAARLRRADGGEESCTADYLVGCDGARSAVRHGLAMDFPGGDYEQLFYVADIEGDGPALDGDLHLDLDTADFLAVFPLKGDGHARLIGTVKGERAEHAEQLTFADVSRTAMDSLHIGVRTVNWFSTYRVHHRVAARFRQGRCLLVGDAAHIHSPAGGQGMNTGIGDAINLAWKLAAVVQSRGPDSLLDSYARERMWFARRLVASTDRAFTTATATGEAARTIRTQAIPRLAPALLKLKALRRFIFRTVSQISLRYPASPLAQGQAGHVHAGARPPLVEGPDGDNLMGLDGVRWTAQVYGEAPPTLAAACERLGVGLQARPWNAAAERAGFARDALYLLRPDGYIALAEAKSTVEALTGYFAERGIDPAPLTLALA